MLVLKCKPGSAIVIKAPGIPDVTIFVRDKNQFVFDAPAAVGIQRKRLDESTGDQDVARIAENAAA
jgi:hypothetical protein